jgi:FixJ family two-component response regulator
MSIAAETASGHILVLDDEPTVRQTLSTILSMVGFDVVCCADSRTLLALARERAPTCILLDLVLSDASGLDVLKELRDDGCAAPVLMISGKADIGMAVRALKQGASDFMEKPFRGPDLIARVKSAIAGHERKCGSTGQPKVNFHFPGRAPLTARERDVLAEVASGCSTKETARRLGLSPRTVEGYRVSIMRKLGVKNPAELVRLVLSSAMPSPRIEH